MVATTFVTVSCLCEVGVLWDTQGRSVQCKQGGDLQVYTPAGKHGEKDKVHILNTHRDGCCALFLSGFG